MIKRTLYFGNPAYLSLKDRQLVISKVSNKVNSAEGDAEIENLRLSEKISIPVEDIGVILLDCWQITVSQPLLNALLANNTSVITCNEKQDRKSVV